MVYGPSTGPMRFSLGHMGGQDHSAACVHGEGARPRTVQPLPHVDLFST